jgi:hypothetical protein
MSARGGAFTVGLFETRGDFGPYIPKIPFHGNYGKPSIRVGDYRPSDEKQV